MSHREDCELWCQVRESKPALNGFKKRGSRQCGWAQKWEWIRIWSLLMTEQCGHLPKGRLKLTRQRALNDFLLLFSQCFCFLSLQEVVAHWIAECRLSIEQARLLTLKTASKIDTLGNRKARKEVSCFFGSLGLGPVRWIPAHFQKITSWN